jgi:hypothetical protein
MIQYDEAFSENDLQRCLGPVHLNEPNMSDVVNLELLGASARPQMHRLCTGRSCEDGSDRFMAMCDNTSRISLEQLSSSSSLSAETIDSPSTQALAMRYHPELVATIRMGRLVAVRSAVWLYVYL